MRKITILEVWDPCESKYVPLKQAVNQGLFNTETYLFYNPKEDKFYSITEAAKIGLFKSAIDLRPEALIVERVKIAQTVSLISARDPDDLTKIMSIRDAIAHEIVDINQRIYRHKNEVIEFSDAIEKDLIQVEKVKEITEKITETLTEQKTADNFGLVKKTETSSTSSLNRASVVSMPSESSHEATTEQTVQQVNGMYVMDLPHSFNVNKRILKNNDEFTAGFITDSNTEKILNNQNDSELKSILRSGSKSLNPIIDLNEAIRNEVVFLPDSLLKTQGVKYVIDLKSGEKLSLDEACQKGVIDIFNRLFIDTRTNKKISLFEALGKFYIVMKEELNNNYEDVEDDKNVQKTQVNSKIPGTESLSLADILTVFNPKTGNQIGIDEAIILGLYDQTSNKYIDSNTNRIMSIEEASVKGMIVLKPENPRKPDDYQFLHINGVINPITKEEMQLTDAIKSGILDYVECEIHDPQSGQTLTLLEAYDKGFLITSTQNRTPLVRKKILKNTTETTIEIGDATTQISTKTNTLIDTNSMDIRPQNFNMKRNSSMSHNRMLPVKPKTTKNMERNGSILSTPVGGSGVQNGNKIAKSHSQSPMRVNKRNNSFDISSSRGKSVDRASITSRASILSKFKDKLFRKTNKLKNCHQFEEHHILESIRVLNTATSEQLDLKSAIIEQLAIPDEKFRDLRSNTELNIREALEQGLLRFFVDNEKTEYSYRQNCFIFGESIYLVKYVLDPNDQKKLSLADAFDQLILDDKNSFYYGKKGPYSIESAIQKGYICCKSIDLSLLNNIIVSNIFTYSTYTVTSAMATENLSDDVKDPFETVQYIDGAELTNEESEKSVEDVKLNPVTVIPNPKDSKITRGLKTQVKTMESMRKKLKNQQEQQATEDISLSSALTTELDHKQELSEEPQLDSNEKPESELNEVTEFEPKTEPEQEDLPKYLINKIALQKNKLNPIYSPTGHLSVELLQESGVKYRKGKKYIVSYVLDEMKDEYVTLRRALKVGILNDETYEFVNSKTGDAMSIPMAIKNNKIKVSEVRERYPSTTLIEEITSVTSESSIMPATESSIMPAIETKLTSTEETTAPSSSSELVETVQEPTSQSPFIDLPNTDATIYNAHMNDSRQSSIVTINENLPNTPSFNFDLVEVLLYRKPSNGKYIRFEKVVKNKLYNPDTGRIKDLNTNEFVTLTEAFTRELVRINDPDILFDKFNVYKIESVLTTSGKNTLTEAIRKKVVNRKMCTYKFLAHTYMIDDAMKEGYIEGLILSNSQIKCLLDDYVKSLQINEPSPSLQADPATSIQKTEQTEPLNPLEIGTDKMNTRSDESLPRTMSKTRKVRTSQSTDELSNRPNTGSLSSKTNLESFNEFFIFDLESEMYITLNEAFLKGIIITKPVRVIEPNSGNFISLKDAVIKGLISTEKSRTKLSLKSRSCFHTSNRVSYIIDAVLDGHKSNRVSLNDATRLGIFRNGLYKNILRSNESLSIDQAIVQGFIVGRKVDLDEIEEIFGKSLSVPPSKPSRGVFMEPSPEEETHQMKSFSSAQNNLDDQLVQEKENNSKFSNKIKFISDYTLNKHGNDQQTQRKEFGRIEMIKDCKSGRYLSLEDATQANIINLNRGLFVNTLTGNTHDIPGAIDAGFIILDYQKTNFVNKFNSMNRSRSLSQSSRKIPMPKGIELNESNIIKVGRQFVITAVLDTANKLYLDLDEAIKVGIFDISSAMYINPKNNKRYTLVDAIDQGYVKIADESFRASYKLIMEEENPRTFRKCIRTFPLRYVVHSVTKQIIPINVAVENNLINIDSGIYIGSDRKMSLKSAYCNHLALTVDDLDRPNSERAKFKVALVKKSTTGKNMSVKSALAKNWLNFDRRVYIDKQTNQEIPFSQAVDMDLLVLIANLPETSETVVNASQINLNHGGNELANSRNERTLSLTKTRSNSKLSSRNV